MQRETGLAPEPLGREPLSSQTLGDGAQSWHLHSGTSTKDLARPAIALCSSPQYKGICLAHVSCPVTLCSVCVCAHVCEATWALQCSAGGEKLQGGVPREAGRPSAP